MEHPVEQHYTRANLLEKIGGALIAAGKDLRRLTVEDLASVDELHVRGREASEELARLTALDPSMHVLDVGCGIGGPARWLAARYGCRVTGIDLTEEFTRTATALAEWVGLQERVTFRQGDALHMPFAAESFDAVWTQHAAMNIADKAGLYAEVARVAKPGAAFAVYDILQGEGGEVLFPVPWASQASLSHLARPEEMKRLLEGAGFEVRHWRDTSAAGLAWFQAGLERARKGQRPLLGLHLVMGPAAPQLLENMVHNLGERRIVICEIACRRK